MNKETTNEARQKRKSIFYIVLSICLIAAGLTSYFSTKSIQKNNKETTGESQSVTQKVNPSELIETQVNRNVKGVPDERYTDETETESPVVREAQFSLPLGTAIVKDFSNSELVESKTMGDWRVHNGIDFKGTEGDVVKAINNGIVTKVYDDALWGTVVEIDHGDGMTARYCGLKAGNTVSKGDYIKINETVGNLGIIPIEEADEPHLHLEIIEDGIIVDPIIAMNKTADELSE